MVSVSGLPAVAFNLPTKKLALAALRMPSLPRLA